MKTTRVSFLALALYAAPALAAPDLVPQSVAAPTTVFSTAPFEVRARVANTGDAAANNFDVAVYLSVDSFLSQFGDTLIGTLTVASLAPGQTVEFKVPNATIPGGASGPAPGAYYVGVILDPQNRLGEPNRANNTRATPTTVTVKRPAPDFIAVEVQSPTRAAAGEGMPVPRVIVNAGLVAGTAVYRYYLSSNDTLSPADIPVFEGSVTLDPAGESIATDIVVLPPELAPGRYELGLIVDPDEEVAEQDELNNVRAGALIDVELSSLTIDTPFLPDALVGIPYLRHLVASGADGPLTWSLASGDLPDGLTLSADGVIDGTPRSPGTFLATFEVATASRAAVRTLILRAFDPMSPLEVATRELPFALVGGDYSVPLAAAGGARPYIWALAGGALPAGLVLQRNGTVTGKPTSALSADFYAEVTDAAGMKAGRQLTLRVVEPGDLAVVTQTLEDAFAGSRYLTQIRAQGGVKPYRWFIEGALPAGLGAGPAGDALQIEGKPIVSGVFSFRARVEDGAGASDRNTFLLSIAPAPIVVITTALPDASRGEPYEAEIVSSAAQANWRLLSGVLPAGLGLDQALGKITGTVTKEAEARSYNFLVEVRDDSAGGLGRAALTIRVNAPAAVTPPKTGCSAAGGAWGFLGLLALAVHRRRTSRLRGAGAGRPRGTQAPGENRAMGRRKRPVRRDDAAPSIAIASALVLLAGSAQAQTIPSYSVLRFGQLYQEQIGGAALAFANATHGSQWVDIGFTFKFFGVDYTQVNVAPNGLLTFEGNADYFTPAVIPATAQPNAVCAPWWDDLKLVAATPGGPSEVTTQLVGNSPDRRLVVQWKNVQDTATPAGSEATSQAFNFQAWLFERTGRIEFRYGPRTSGSGTTVSLRATVGLENQAGTEASQPFLCSPYCTAMQDQQVVAFSVLADLVVQTLTGPSLAYAGLGAPVSLTVQNAGSSPVTTTARVYLSDDAFLDAGDAPIWNVPATTFPAGQTKVLSNSAAVIPPGTAPGIYWLIGAADPDGEVDEDNETNNVIVATEVVRIGPPAADFTSEGLGVSPLNAEPGDSVNVSFTFRNIGNAPGAGAYWVVLSTNDVISAQDRKVAEGSALLGALEERSLTVPFTVPDDLPARAYNVGVVADPESLVQELSELNNASRAAQTLAVHGDLAIATEELPAAVVGGRYGLRLQAVGGNGLYLWRVAAGSQIPSGLTLSPFGDLSGTPRAAGTAPFSVTVDSGTASVTQAFTLRVDETGLPLTLVTAELPAGLFAREYRFALSVMGGAAPYLFTVRDPESGEPAPGLVLTTEGVLGGVPRQDGTFRFRVKVEDADDAVVERDLTLRVVPSGRPVITQTELADATLSRPYDGRLQAAGGKAPYVWTLTRSRRIPTGPNDPAGEEFRDPPPGLNLTDDGALTGVPVEAGFYALAVRVVDANGFEDFDTVTLRVRADRGVSIVQRLLREAFRGQDYDVSLQVNGAEGRTTWSLVDPDLGGLPDGMALRPDGRIFGRPTTLGTRSFIIRVEDERRRVDVRALSITVREPPRIDTGSGGCASGGGGGLWALAGLLAIVVRRGGSASHRRLRGAGAGRQRVTFAPGENRAMGRRKRPGGAGAMPTAALAALVSLVSCGAPTNTDLCAGKVCSAPGETCDPADGICKCGGPGGQACAADEFCNFAALACEPIDRCAFVQCRGGASCDPADGVCKCGGAGGQICGEDEVCDAGLARCVKVDLCAGVVCVEETACDPADGKCKCGGPSGRACNPGERCSEGICVNDPCASVHCTGGTTCDPATASCKCGGAGGQACLYGQICQPDRKECLDAPKCQGVVCTGNSSCSPLDGRCHCGSSTGPVCAFGQTCDVETRTCLGGDRCANTTCPSNTFCDRETGRCRCGSEAGPLCASNEVCLVSGAEPSCRALCNPLQQACPSNQGCYFDPAPRTSYCAPGGTVGEGARCYQVTDCTPGLHCVIPGFGGSGFCRYYCSTVLHECSISGRACESILFAPDDLGACDAQ